MISDIGGCWEVKYPVAGNGVLSVRFFTKIDIITRKNVMNHHTSLHFFDANFLKIFIYLRYITT